MCSCAHMLLHMHVEKVYGVYPYVDNFPFLNSSKVQVLESGIQVQIQCKFYLDYCCHQFGSFYYARQHSGLNLDRALLSRVALYMEVHPRCYKKTI